MPNFTFFTTIPATNNSPSSDQPKMLTNNVSTNSILAVDHFTFNDNLGGIHKQVTLQNTNLLAGQQVLVTASTSGQTQVFAKPDAGGNNYQLTRFIDNKFTLFATDTVYPGAQAFENGGWTFLPGGLLFQYGSSLPGSVSPSTGTTNFPIAFTGVPFCVMLSPVSKAGGANINNTVSLVTGTLGNTSFGWNWQGSTTQYTGFYWTAIGI